MKEKEFLPPAKYLSFVSDILSPFKQTPPVLRATTKNVLWHDMLLGFATSNAQPDSELKWDGTQCLEAGCVWAAKIPLAVWLD